MQFQRVRQYAPTVTVMLYRATATTLLALLFSFLILVDLNRIKAGISRLRTSRVGDFYEEAAPPIARFGIVLGRAVEAQAAIAVVNTVLTLIGLLLLDIPLVAMLSIIVFVCSFVPVLGVFISTTPIVLVALNTGGPGLSLAAIGLVIVIHAIEAYVLNPLIYGRHLKLNPVLTLIILYVGYHAFGLWGMLLGVPVARYFIHDVIGVPRTHSRARALRREAAATARRTPRVATVMSLLRRLFDIANRRPWLLPAISFAAGWVGFLLVRRGEELARIVALLALCGWFWLLVEPWVRRRLERRRRRVGNFVVNFVSQSLQQELLFFSLPLLIGATQLGRGPDRIHGPRRRRGAADHHRSALRALRCEPGRTAHDVSRVLQLDRGARRVADGAARARREGAADLAARRRRVVAADVAAVAVLAAALAQPRRVACRHDRPCRSCSGSCAAKYRQPASR